jgi:tight adherence protein C
MLYGAVFTVFLMVFVLSYGLLFMLKQDSISVEDRLELLHGLDAEVQKKEETKSFYERALEPCYQILISFLMKATPSHKIAAFNKRLERAGLLKNSSTEKWLYTKSMVTLITGIFFGIMVYSLDPNILKAGFLSIFVVLLISTVFNFYVSSKIEDRKKKILKDLPYTLDLITVSVEAGASFDGAMARVINNIKGELCDEFAKALKEIRMGIQRKTALKNMSDRCEVKELSMLVTSLIQADDLGVSLGKVLRIESANLREHRKQAAREQAMKAPIKMLFPLILFIFPSIFIIILGPSVIKMINVFAG